MGRVRGAVGWLPSCLEADADGWYPSRSDWFDDAGWKVLRGRCRLVRKAGIGGINGCVIPGRRYGEVPFVECLRSASREVDEIAICCLESRRCIPLGLVCWG
jgi:hypothetical protein